MVPRRALVLCLAFIPAGCALDWGSLKPDGGDGADATDDTVVNPFDATTRDVSTDTPADRADTADAADSAWDDSGLDATSAGDADDSGESDAGPDATADATDAGDASGASDASDASDAGEASDASDASDASCAYTFTGTLATYDFSGEPGNQVSTAASSSAAGLTAGAISRSSAITAELGANSINSSDWATTTTLDATRYYTLTLTPPSKCALALTSISIETQVSGTGPADGAAATSSDGFSSKSTFTPGSTTSVSLSVSGATTAVEIRIYGYDASGTAGTMRIENTMTVSGSLM